MDGNSSGLIYPNESFVIRGALFEVYRIQGSGFVEPVYHECLLIEFQLRQIPHYPKPRVSLLHKDQRLAAEYVPDFVCFETILIELKAVSALTDEHRAQVHNYLKATGLRLGFLANFGHHPKIELERIIR